MIDYHVHPDYSIDAQGSIDEYCKKAVERGLKEIAFTTHVDTDPETDDCIVSVRGKTIDVRTSRWIEDYEYAIRAAEETYVEQGLTVLMGMELDIYPEVVNNLPESILSAEWDLVIGSMHLIDHLAISKRSDAALIFSRYTLEELGTLYYSTLQDTVETSIINVLGHIDLYRRYGNKFYGEEIDDLWKPYIDTLAEKMKKHDVGFEINTLPWRKGMAQPHPSPHLIEMLTGKGIKTVTLGSDSHFPEDIGSDIVKAARMLDERCGLKPSRFRKGNAVGRIEGIGTH